MGSIYFVDSQAYTVIRQDSITAIPVKILSTGFFLIFENLWGENSKLDR
jgi:hypothetical protein